MSKSIVIESGTFHTRAGYGGAQFPELVQPTLVGRGQGENSNETFVGTAAQSRRESLLLSQPVQGGVITNWEDVERLWTSVLTDHLGVDPHNHNVLLLDSPSVDMAAREKMAEIMLETFNAKGFFVANSAVTTLYSTGRMAGVVLEAGEGVIHAVPVHDGFALPNAITRWEFGGSGQSEYLKKLLSEKGYNLSSEAVRDIKEKACYVALGYKLEMAKSTDPGIHRRYKLPDGTEVDLGSEMFKSSEILFQPSLDGISSGGVTTMLQESISKCTTDQQKGMMKNIVLGGGPTLTTGFPARLKKDMKSLVGHEADVVALEHRLHAAWMGGCILANMETFQPMWITSAEYQEKGVAIVQEKCK